MKKVYAFIVTCLLACLCAMAQTSFFDNYVYQQWNSVGSLSGTTANDIVQTSDGFVNIATYEGLVRFDGLAFSTMKKGKNNDYTFSSVRCILEDRSGNFWIASNEEGIQLIKKDGSITFSTQNGLPNNSVRSLVEDRDGNIWVGTVAGVVYLTKTKRLKNPQFEAGIVTKGVLTKQLFCDRSGKVWLITENAKGLFVFENGLFRSVPQMDFLGDYSVTSIGQDRNGFYWVGLGTGGMVKIEGNKARLLVTNTMLDTEATHTIYTSEDGTLWFGTEKGLVVFSKGRFYEYKNDAVLGVHINKISGDREGDIWLATDKNGIGKLTHGRFKMFKIGTAVNAIAEGKDGRIWIGSDSGVFCYKDESPLTNELTQYTEGIRIRHVELAENGDILVSCYSKPGQLRYHLSGKNKGTIDSWTTDDGLAGNKVRIAIEDGLDNIFVGTTTGLSIINKDGGIRTFKQIDGLENEYIMCLYKDDKGVIWVGTDGGGVFFFKDKEIIGKVDTENGLPGNVIFKISQDSEGAYWICTGKGLVRCPSCDFDKDRIPTEFQIINSNQGLDTDSIFQIVSDKMGDVWYTSNYGIFSSSFADLVAVAQGEKEFLPIKPYNRNDGLDSAGPTSTSLSICDHRGRLWFTMIDGFALYDPNKIQEKPVVPLVYIESITIDTVEYKSPSHASVIELKSGTKRVLIKFTGLCFDAPDRIQFTHQLTNFEEDFSEPGMERTISYTNLKPGKHVFMVKAISGSGVVSDKAESMLFMQKPYFYQTKSFWISSFLIFFSILLTVFYLKQNAIKKENIRLDGLVKQRTAQLQVEKEKSDQLLRAILPDKIAEELKDSIRAIGENFTDVTMLFSDIVSFTTISSTHSAQEIVTALNDLFCRFDERAKSMGVEKIKTIGDAYMAGCGLPTRNRNHARIMVEFAKGMYEDLKAYNDSSPIKFNIRIGLNSGPVNAGVIGKTKFIYDVWGNTVNVASRMESACTPGGIRVSQSLYEHLKDSDIVFSSPIECNIKGKGLMTTYDVLEVPSRKEENV